MTSSSPPQNETPLHIRDITEKLSKLLEDLNNAKDDYLNKSRADYLKVAQKESKEKQKVPEDSKKKGEVTQQVPKDGKTEKKEEMEIANQFDKANTELYYMIGAFKKLVAFEGDTTKSLETLERNVKDIQADLVRALAYRIPDDFLMQAIERNLKVLRSNLTKVKILIPLQHQVSVVQTKVASQEVLPNPYEAKQIFETGSFVKEFQDHYDALGNKHKLFLLCFAIFPENAEVKKRLLRFWWLGERLIDPEEDFVNETLVEFVEKGFIEPVTKKGKLQATSYKMHPIIRSLIIKVAREANFFDYDSNGNPTMEISASKKSSLVKSYQGIPWFSKNFLLEYGVKQKPESSDNQQNNNKPGKEEQQRKISNQQRTKREKQRLENLEELQTLFNVSRQFPDLPLELFSKMRNIGVLSLGRWESTAERHIEVVNTEFLNGLKNMKKLRFFSLQGISGIQKLPKSLSKLTGLRILDLRACYNLETLPDEIGSLKRLTYLDLSECYCLDNISKQLSRLPNLKVLKGFLIIKHKGSCTLDDLKTLFKLEKLSINVKDENFSINDAGVIFFKLKALQKLKIAWKARRRTPNSMNEEKFRPRDNDKRKGNPNPQMPQLSCGEGSSKSGEFVKIPDDNEVDKSGVSNKDEKKQGSGMKMMEKLEKLDLQFFPERDPPNWVAPEKLKNLKHLYIRGGILSNLGKTESWMPDNKGNWEVETLRLKSLTDMKTNWKELQTQFPKLNYLEKVKCPLITFCPCDANGVWTSKKP